MTLWISITLIVSGLVWAAWIVFGPDVVTALIKRAKRTPYSHLRGGDYMRRYWVIPYIDAGSASTQGVGPVPFRKRPIAWVLQRLGVAARIHEIMASDEGRDPHDHPWTYLSVILQGVYWERRFDNRGRCISVKMHGPGSIIFRPARSWHMLELHQGPVTTLFITFRKQQRWGFNVEGTKVPHNEYTRK